MLRFLSIFLGCVSFAHCISLKEAIKKACEGSVDLISKLKEIESIHEKYVEARAEWLPKAEANFSLKKDYPTDSSPQRTQSGAQRSGIYRSGGLTITQNIYRGGQTNAKMKSVDYNVKAKWAEFQATEQKVISEVIKNYCEILANIAAIKSHEANVEAVRVALNNAQHRLAAGAETSTQTAVAEQRFADASAKLQNAQAELDVKKAAFLRLVGVPLGDVSDKDLIQLVLPTNDAAMLQEAEDKNPTILQAHFSYLAAQKEIDAATDNYQPEVNLEAEMSRREEKEKYSHDQYSELFPQHRTVYRTDRNVGIKVKWNLYNGGITAATRREKGDLAISKRVEKDGKKNQVIEALVSAITQYRSAKQLIVLYTQREQAGLVALHNTQAEVEAGSKVLKDALDAQAEVQQARLARIEAEKNMHIAFYQIFEHMGRLNSEQLKLGTQSYDKLLIRHYEATKKRFY